jgi:hypothetical protein
MTRNYRRYKGQCCVQIRNTRAWRIVKEIKDFVYDVTQKEDEPEMWKNLTSRGNLVSDVVKHLTNCKDFQFPEIKKDRHVWSFQNGLLIGKDWDGAKNTVSSFTIIIRKTFVISIPLLSVASTLTRHFTRTMTRLTGGIFQPQTCKRS